MPRIFMLSIVALVLMMAAPAQAAHNDNYLGGQILVPASGATSHNNIGATTEPGEPTFDGHITSTVWYHWVATKSGNVTFNACQSDFRSTVVAYRGLTVNTLTHWAGNFLTCEISFLAVAGITYHIQVGSYCVPIGPGGSCWDSGREGNYTLQWNMKYGLL